MTIEQAVRERLVADPTLSALVATKVYAQEAPQESDPPYVLYATSDPYQFEGLADRVNLYSEAFRFDCYGGDSSGAYASAKSVASAVRACLFGLENNAQLGTSGLDLAGLEDLGGEDSLEPPLHADGAGIDYVGVTVRIFWRTH